MNATAERTATVVAVFDTPEQAQAAIRSLADAGVRREDISVVSRHGRESVDAGRTEADAHTGETSTIGEYVGGGAIWGGVGGLLLGIAGLAIPGIGPVIAAGPLASALAATGIGAGIGAATGGIIGAIQNAGVPEEEAHLYAEAVRRGGTLVTVHAMSADTDRIKRVLDDAGAVDIEERGRDYRTSGWNRFDENASSYDMGTTGTTTGSTARDVGRSAGKTVGRAINKTENAFREGKDKIERTGTRVFDRSRSGMAGTLPNTSGMSGTTSSTTSVPNTTTAGSSAGLASSSAGLAGTAGLGSSGTSDWRQYDTDFQRDYQTRYSSMGGRYTDYEPAYQYGYRMANDPRYRGQNWNSIESDLRRDYESNYPGGTWERMKDAVRYGWDKVTGKV